LDYFLLQVKKHRLYILLAPVFRLSFPYLAAGILVAVTTLLLVISRSQWNTTRSPAVPAAGLNQRPSGLGSDSRFLAFSL
jgi:hypothetical protein